MNESPTHRPGRNDRCPCGSGKKYKQCCLAKDAAADRLARAEAAAAVPPLPPSDAEPGPDAPRRPTVRPRSIDQPWKRDQQRAPGFQKRSGPRKRGAS